MNIKKTKSLCPECLKPLEAEVYDEDGKVRIKKECSEHGMFDNTYWSNTKLYKRVNEYNPTIKPVENYHSINTKGCPSGCGLCNQHETTTILGLIDVTNRCNLRCPVCFSNAAVSKRIYEPSYEEIKEMLRNLRNLKPVPTSAIQYSGGEPTVREDIVDLIKLAIEKGFSHTQIATNGIRISQDINFAQELAGAGLNTVYLQFDGVTEEPYIYNRNKNVLPQKLKAIENCRKVGLGVVLVPTIVKGINNDQIGDIIRFAIDNVDIVHGVNFQPVSFSGRTPSEKVEEQRITISDFVKLVSDQIDGAIVTDDFYPPSSVESISKFIGAYEGENPSVILNCHQHCGIATYVFIEDDKIIPVTRFINVDGFFEFLDKTADKLNEGGFAIKSRILINAIKELPKLLNKENSPETIDVRHILGNVLSKRSYSSLGDFHKNSLLIACMHFMDPFNFDEDRVKKCVIHYAVPDGRIIPFCAMNSLHRQEIEDEFSIPISEYNKKNQ